MEFGGIIGEIWGMGNVDDNFIINNTLNLGNISQNVKNKGEILGRHVKSNSCVLGNCFYKSESTNKGIGSGTVTGETTATEIDETLITTLNEYVTDYNTTNKDNEDFIELKSWELSGEQVKFK